MFSRYVWGCNVRFKREKGNVKSELRTDGDAIDAGG